MSVTKSEDLKSGIKCTSCGYELSATHVHDYGNMCTKCMHYAQDVEEIKEYNEEQKKKRGKEFTKALLTLKELDETKDFCVKAIRMLLSLIKIRIVDSVQNNEPDPEVAKLKFPMMRAAKDGINNLNTSQQMIQNDFLNFVLRDIKLHKEPNDETKHIALNLCQEYETDDDIRKKFDMFVESRAAQ